MFFGISSLPYRYESVKFDASIIFRKPIAFPSSLYATNSLINVLMPIIFATERQSSVGTPNRNAIGQNRYLSMVCVVDGNKNHKYTQHDQFYFTGPRELTENPASWTFNCSKNQATTASIKLNMATKAIRQQIIDAITDTIDTAPFAMVSNTPTVFLSHIKRKIVTLD